MLDPILVLDEGRVVERGTHADLVEQGGLYVTLYVCQFRSILSGPRSRDRTGQAARRVGLLHGQFGAESGKCFCCGRPPHHAGHHVFERHVGTFLFGGRCDPLRADRATCVPGSHPWNYES